MIEFSYAISDPDFFAPLAASKELGQIYRPSQVPDGWQIVDKGHWTFGRRDGVKLASRGWKVHVSAKLDRAPDVLDVFADFCYQQDVTFKFLSNEMTFLFAHHKHASRAQAGKFCVGYPADETASARLMAALTEALAGEEGPFILTDRRYPGSKVVHYRYGSYTEGSRMRPDGTSQGLVTNGAGRLVEDHRGVSFHLPDGITDPFVQPEPELLPDAGLLKFREYTFEAALRHSNGGGAYRAIHKPTGRTVFVKEARDQNGLTWDREPTPERLRREWETLRHLHANSPGLCPEPIDYFRVWEHEYLVTEFIAGTALQPWMVANSTVVRAEATPEDFTDYYETCQRILAAIETALDRLHERGFAFGDVSGGNVVVTEDETPRLIDFEAAHRIDEPGPKMGTDGYVPPKGMLDDPVARDRYGLSALAQLLVWPLHATVQRNPDALAHLHHDVRELAPLPQPLWQRVTQFHQPSDDPPLPGPEQVAADPHRHLGLLRDRTAEALLAMADPDHPDRVFPTSPNGYATNTLCVAYGTAGVLHALRQAKLPVADEIVDRLRRESVAAVAELPPGFYAGVAGIAWVLADFGHVEEAEHLLAAAGRHPILGECATLAGGSAGVAMAHLGLYGHTGDNRHLDAAVAVAAVLPEGEELREHIGAGNAAGLLNGRTGIALMLQQLAHATGDDSHLTRGVRLLHEELDLATNPDAASWTFPVSETDHRTTPYLSVGTAGILRTVSRYLRMVADERLTEALPRLLIHPRTLHTAYVGLYQGLAGLGLAMSEHAELADDASSRDVAFRIGRAVFKYAIPHETGVRFLGDRMMRYSAELNNGSAGVLLFLTQLLEPRADPLFTIDSFRSETHAGRSRELTAVSR